MSGKPYVPTQEKLDCLLRSFRTQGDYKAVGFALGMKRRTIDDVIRKYCEQNRDTLSPRGGHANPNTKVDNEMLNFLIFYLEQVNPAVCTFLWRFNIYNFNHLKATLGELNRQLKVQLPWKPKVSDKTIHVHLDKALITYKVCCLVCIHHIKLSFHPKVLQRAPAARNSLENAAYRAAWVRQFQTYLQWGCSPIFMDEMGANLWTVPRYGRAHKGMTIWLHIKKRRGGGACS